MKNAEIRLGNALADGKLTTSTPVLSVGDLVILEAKHAKLVIGSGLICQNGIVLNVVLSWDIIIRVVFVRNVDCLRHLTMERLSV